MAKYLYLRGNLTIGLIVAFLFNFLGPLPVTSEQSVYGAERGFSLPAPGILVPLSPNYNPPALKGIKVHPENPFKFDFILDQGDQPNEDRGLQAETTKLIKYFLASLTTPDNDLWVNLSPYEKNRIIPGPFGRTEMGRDLLAEDYMLKQITASLLYPEGKTGKEFWRKVYTEAARRFKTTNIPVNTVNKVWIVPEKAVVYENPQAGTAYVVQARLKVMLEEDYLALRKNTTGADSHGVLRPVGGRGIASDPTNLASQIIREIVLPELGREVNEGQNFAQLRQIYNSLILANWYKKKIKDSILAQVYEDKNKVQGTEYADSVIQASPARGHVPDIELIYRHYIQAFKKGAYNYIKEESDPITRQMVPRKYFSGGTAFDDKAMDAAMAISENGQLLSGIEDKRELTVETDLAMVSPTPQVPNHSGPQIRIVSDLRSLGSSKDVWSKIQEFNEKHGIMLGQQGNFYFIAALYGQDFQSLDRKRHKTRFVIAADQNNNIVGYIFYEIEKVVWNRGAGEGWRVNIDYFEFHPDHKDQNTAIQLLKAVFEIEKERQGGLALVKAHVSDLNEDAKRLYESLPGIIPGVELLDRSAVEGRQEFQFLYHPPETDAAMGSEMTRREFWAGGLALAVSKATGGFAAGREIALNDSIYLLSVSYDAEKPSLLLIHGGGDREPDKNFQSIVINAQRQGYNVFMYVYNDQDDFEKMLVPKLVKEARGIIQDFGITSKMTVITYSYGSVIFRGAVLSEEARIALENLNRKENQKTDDNIFAGMRLVQFAPVAGGVRHENPLPALDPQGEIQKSLYCAESNQVFHKVIGHYTNILPQTDAVNVAHSPDSGVRQRYEEGIDLNTGFADIYTPAAEHHDVIDIIKHQDIRLILSKLLNDRAMVSEAHSMVIRLASQVSSLLSDKVQDADITSEDFFLKAHANNNLYHNLLHSTGVGAGSESIARALGFMDNLIIYLKQIGNLHDVDIREANTSASVQRTSALLKNDWNNEEALDGDISKRSYLREVLGWNELMFYMALAIIQRSEYPFWEKNKFYTNSTPVENYTGYLSKVRELGGEAAWEFTVLWGVYFSEYIDKTEKYMRLNFGGVIKAFMDLAVEKNKSEGLGLRGDALEQYQKNLILGTSKFMDFNVNKDAEEFSKTGLGLNGSDFMKWDEFIKNYPAEEQNLFNNTKKLFEELAHRVLYGGGDYDLVLNELIERSNKEGSSDSAMRAGIKGGIDLTPARFDLKVKTGSLPVTSGVNQGIRFSIDPAIFKQFQDAPGFVPVIIAIRPMTNLKEFLGAG